MSASGLLPLYVDPASPLLLVHVTGVLVAFATAAYAFRHRDYPGVGWFVAWSLCTGGWLAGHTIGLAIADPETRILIQSLAFAVTPLTSLAWVGFAMTYTGRASSLTPRRLRALGAVAVALAVYAATNPVHGQLVADLSVERVAGVEAITGFSANPGFWVVNAFVYPLFLVGLLLLVELVLSGRRLHTGQGVALLLAAGLPLTAALLYLSGQSPVPVNLTPLFSAVSTLPVAYAVFRTRLLDLVPAFQRVGERAAVHALDDGVLVLDPAERVVVVNASAADILNADRDDVRGRPIGEVLETAPLEASAHWVDDEAGPGGRYVAEGGSDEGTAGDEAREDTDEGSPDAHGGTVTVPPRLRDARTGRFYSVTGSRIDDREDGALGRTLVLRDVTQERRRKQRLLVLNRVVRHNLRNDMTVLLGHARMLASDEDDESLAVVEEIGSHLIGLGESAQEIDAIIRQSADPDRPVNVAGVVERVCVRQRRAHPDVDFDVRVPDQAWTASRGPVIEAIVSNLVENAAVHGRPPTRDSNDDAAVSDDGRPGEVQSDGRGGSDRPCVTVVLERLSDRLELVVADDGPGIPQQELESVLQGEVSDLHHASGLGLWMVKWCVDLADARWTVDTQSGTRVVVSFDRTDAGDRADA